MSYRTANGHRHVPTHSLRVRVATALTSGLMKIAFIDARSRAVEPFGL